MQDSATWQTSDGDRIPWERFGKDHWSTLAYIETRIVDASGLLNPDQMRVSAKLHMSLAATQKAQRALGASGPEYPTRLKTIALNDETGQFGVDEIFGHDDYSCVDDLLAAGILTVEMPQSRNGVMVDTHGKVCQTPDGMPIRADVVSGMVEGYLMARARFGLTKRGKQVAGALRAWKGEGNNYHQFYPQGLIPASASLEVAMPSTAEISV